MREKYRDFWDKGKYLCSKCGLPLFSSLSKFNSGTPWPSFRKAFKEAVNVRKRVYSDIKKNEAICGKCGQHLGHLFEDGKITGDTHPKAELRYSILSKSIKFAKNNKAP
ncbi:MAG: peptide-methionine (R)-S-oxide reductase [Nanoarchaeota archaeon]|nr:peptide-methionine (R)-S-oxide reductase [Nanoarchaeota archaeon]